MREFKKIWYMDRIFIMIIMLILICSGLIMSHKKIRVLKETIELEQVIKDIEAADYLIEDTIEDTVRESAKDYYSILAEFVSAILILSFFVKWMMAEQGGKSEFQASLPIPKRSYVLAEMIELLGSVLVMVIFCFSDLVIRTAMIYKQESISLPLFRQTGAIAADIEYLSGCFVYIVFHVILFMLLHTFVGRIEALPFVEILLILFVPIMVYTATDTGLVGSRTVFGFVTGFHDRSLIPWQICSVLNTHGTANTHFISILLLLLICLMSFVIYLYSGQKDSSGRKPLGGGIFEYLCLIVALAELHGFFTVGLYDLFMDVSTLHFCNIAGFIAALIVAGMIWYLIDGHFHSVSLKKQN